MKGTLFLLAFVVGALVGALVVAGEEISINVKPNGRPNTVSVTLGDGPAVCSFTYQAVGGTNEDWMMDIQQDRNTVTCTIARPSGTSYLYFQSFSATLDGLAGERLDVAEVWDDSGLLLVDDAFVVDGNSIKQHKGFKGLMTKLTLGK